MKVYFHIGLHKTGSTFLQKEVFPNIPQNNFKYIGGIVDRFKELVYQDPVFYNADHTRIQLEKLMDKDKINLISDENLSGDPQNGGIYRSSIIAKIYQCFPNAKIILFIRRQDNWAISNYRGSIRRGSNLSLENFFLPVLNPQKAWVRRYPNPTIELFKYYYFVDYIKNTFGEDGLLLLPYESLKENPTKIIKKICLFMNVDTPKYKNIKRNYSWGRIRIFIHRMFNLFFVNQQNPYGFIKGIPFYNYKEHKISFMTFNKFLTAINQLDNFNRFINKIDLKYKDKKQIGFSILKKCKKDNYKIHKEFNINLKKYGYF